MSKVYTRTGDLGTTAIHGGARVDKDDPRIEANGTLDELTCALGLVRSLLETDHPWQEDLREIQLELMAAMSLVATPSTLRDHNPNSLSPTLVGHLEECMDRMNAEINEREGYFILPGGTPLAAHLHQARVVARRAERRLVTLHHMDPVPAQILVLINRLSDLLFVMARYEVWQKQLQEDRWRAFAYKRKLKGKEV